jgi:hypothetical protein
MLSLITAPAAASPLLKRDAVVENEVAKLRLCWDANQQVEPIPAHRGLYELLYSAKHGCTVLTNTSDTALRIWGSHGWVHESIDPPYRPQNTLKGWVDETTARAADQAEETNPGGVVILPGETVRLFASPEPPAYYHLVLADMKANKAAKVAASLADLAVNRQVKVLSARIYYRDAIHACAVAADRTWQEGFTSLPDVLANMADLGPCKTAYDAIAPTTEPAKEPWYKPWIKKASQYGDEYWAKVKVDFAKMARAVLTLR